MGLDVAITLLSPLTTLYKCQGKVRWPCFKEELHCLSAQGKGQVTLVCWPLQATSETALLALRYNIVRRGSGTSN